MPISFGFNRQLPITRSEPHKLKYVQFKPIHVICSIIGVICTVLFNILKLGSISESNKLLIYNSTDLIVQP